MAGIPEAVRKAAEEADRKAQEVTQGKAGEAPAPAAAPAQREPVPAQATEAPAAPQAAAAAPEPVPAAEAESTQVVEDVHKDSEDPNSMPWRQRYQSLKGVFKAAVADEVEKATQALKTVIGQLQAQVAALSAGRATEGAPAAAPAATESAPARPKRHISDEMATEYEDLGAGIKGVEDDLLTTKELAQRAEQAANAARQAVFEQTLSTLKPDWKEIVSNPLFAGYMQQEHGRTGYPIGAYFDQAVHLKDVERVAGFLQDFEQTFPDWSVSAPATPAAPRAVRPKVESQVSPASRRAEPAGGAMGKKTISTAYMKTFADDVSKGRYRGRTDEMKRIQDEIDAAVRERRVTP